MSGYWKKAPKFAQMLHMKGTVHVFDLLASATTDGKPADLPSGLCPIFGTDRFLKKLAIAALTRLFASGDEDFAATTYEGSTATWPDIKDELFTRSLFGGDGPKFVIVDDAEPFVKNQRPRLEDLVKENVSGLLVIVVDKWASNTRLFKAAAKNGLQIKCSPPLKGKSKNTDEKRVQQWLVERAATEYEYTLPTNGAQTIIELTECNFGRMDQELQKIALYVDKKGKVTNETIKQAVGGWRAETMWEALDAAVEGDAGKALELLDHLLRGGEYPLALFGQMAWSLRRYGQATEIVYQQMRAGKKPRIGDAVRQAGFNAWGGELDAAEARLKKMGSARSGKILDWLLEADMALKRSHSHEDRGRLVLETLLVKMADELAPA